MTVEEMWQRLVQTNSVKCATCHDYIDPDAHSWELVEGRPRHVFHCP